MAHDLHIREPEQKTESGPSATLWPVSSFAFAAVAFLAGAASSAFLRQESWQWESPAAVACLLMALLCTGITMMSFILANSRNREAAQTRFEIAEARAYARAILARETEKSAEVQRQIF